MASQPAVASLPPLLRNLEGAFNDGRWSDLRISCQGRTWDVHKVIVCSQCKFFAAACDGKFKESHTNVITMDDDPRPVVDSILRFMYTGDYEDGDYDYDDDDDDDKAEDDKDASQDHASSVQDDEDPRTASILFNVWVQTAADKYDLPELAELATKKFEELAYEGWDKDGFADAIEEIYTNGPDTKETLREIAVRVAAEHARDLTTKKFGKRFREVIDTIPSFAAQVLARAVEPGPSSKHISNQSTYKCPGCARPLKRDQLEPYSRQPIEYKQCKFCSTARAIWYWEEHCEIL